jgi:hypothetical protein
VLTQEVNMKSTTKLSLDELAAEWLPPKLLALLDEVGDDSTEGGEGVKVLLEITVTKDTLHFRSELRLSTRQLLFIALLALIAMSPEYLHLLGPFLLGR